MIDWSSRGQHQRVAVERDRQVGREPCRDPDVLIDEWLIAERVGLVTRLDRDPVPVEHVGAAERGAAGGRAQEAVLDVDLQHRSVDELEPGGSRGQERATVELVAR